MMAFISIFNNKISIQKPNHYHYNHIHDVIKKFIIKIVEIEEIRKVEDFIALMMELILADSLM